MTAPGELPGGRPHGVRAPTRNAESLFFFFFFIQKVQFVFNSSEQGQPFKLLDGWRFTCKAFLFFKPWCKDQSLPLWNRHTAFPMPKAKATGFSTELHKPMQDHESKEDP